MIEAPAVVCETLETLPDQKVTGGRLGSTCEITRGSFHDFMNFWRENPRLARFALQTEARSLLAGHRVGNCLRVRISAKDPVGVLHVASVRGAHYGNLQTCSSVWVCPICASKIATRRREELAAGVENWTGKDGNTVLLATFTLQHLAADSCGDILGAITSAHSDFWRWWQGKGIVARYRIAGRVRGLEVVDGLNGWHWHYHVLLFIQGGVTAGEVDQLRGDMSEHWQSTVKRGGRYADGVHGVDVRATNRDVVDYVSKYGLEGDGKQNQGKGGGWSESHELALGHIKRASSGGLTAFQLLALSLCGEKEAGTRFVEYVRACKGKSQLHWSPGLRALLGLGREKSDQELAEEQHEKATILAQLEQHHWRVILGNAARGELLKVADSGDPWLVLEFLEDLGVYDAYLPDLVHDENYHGKFRIYG